MTKTEKKQYCVNKTLSSQILLFKHVKNVLMLSLNTEKKNCVCMCIHLCKHININIKSTKSISIQ